MEQFEEHLWVFMGIVTGHQISCCNPLGHLIPSQFISLKKMIFFITCNYSWLFNQLLVYPQNSIRYIIFYLMLQRFNFERYHKITVLAGKFKIKLVAWLMKFFSCETDTINMINNVKHVSFDNETYPKWPKHGIIRTVQVMTEWWLGRGCRVKKTYGNHYQSEHGYLLSVWWSV